MRRYKCRDSAAGEMIRHLSRLVYVYLIQPTILVIVLLLLGRHRRRGDARTKPVLGCHHRPGRGRRAHCGHGSLHQVHQPTDQGNIERRSPFNTRIEADKGGCLLHAPDMLCYHVMSMYPATSNKVNFFRCAGGLSTTTHADIPSLV